MMRPAATLGIDVDPVDVHLAGYGHANVLPDPLAYTLALPRLVTLLEGAGLRATFFVIGRDAAAFAKPITRLAAAGHEVASRSFSAPLAFARLTSAQMHDEFVASRNALASACGVEVTGFRAPRFDFDVRGIGALATAGYDYDASAYPTPLLAPGRARMAIGSLDLARTLRLRAWPFTLRRVPHAIACDVRQVVEFPLSVTPVLRIPLAHGARDAISERHFLAILDGFVRRGEPLSYALSAVDVLGLAEDRLDPRLARHPGMALPLEHKLERIARTFEAIAARFEVATFATRAHAMAGAREAAPGLPANPAARAA